MTALIAAPHLAFRAAPFAKRSRAPRVSAERPHSSKAPRVVTVMAASKAARGAFILFEGVDRCGKTTQSTRLVETLKASGVDAELWRYPDRTTGMGQMINAYLQSKTEMDDGAIHLLFSANRWEKRAAMEEKLSSGVTLVVDRYSYSALPSPPPRASRDWTSSGARRPSEASSDRTPCSTSTCPSRRRRNAGASERNATRPRTCRRRSGPTSSN